MRNPVSYARAKAAANRAYSAWDAAHSSLFGPALSLPAAISALVRPGLNAAQGGGSTPPDTTGAIGPNYYVEFVNSEIAVYSRNTLASPPVQSAPEDTFVGSIQTCDGQIKWDQAAGRWEYWSLDCGATPGANGFSFGWSKTSSPTPLTGATANWCRFHLNTTSNLEDYGKLGNDNSFMIVGANEFPDSGAGSDSPIFAIPKPANGSTACPTGPSVTKFAPAAANAFTPEPANIFGSSATGFIVATNPDDAHLRLYTLKGTTTPTLTDQGNVTVPAFSVPAGVPQPGSSDQIDSSDTRLTQAVAAFDPAIKTYGVWAQHTVAGKNGGPSVVRWYELRGGVSQAAPVQTGTVSVTGAFAFNGAISPTAHGTAAAIDYNVGSSSLKVQVRAQDRPAGTALGSMLNETTLANSTGINADFSCPSQGGSRGVCRWGDYGGASPDPICAGQVWGTNEINGPTAPGSASWATENFRLQLDECPLASFTFSPSSPAHGSPVTFNASASSDPDGSITKYAWNFGDGVTSTQTTPTIAHTYAVGGKAYRVVLTVTDSSGLTTTSVKNVPVS